MFHSYFSKRHFESQLKKIPISFESFQFPKDQLFLNKTDDSFLKKNTCALVGNSGHLLDQNLAKNIDDHDVVIRFNLGPVQGFEDTFGKKTTLRMINNKAFSGVKDPMAPEERDDQLLDFIDDRLLVVGWEDRLFQQSNRSSIKSSN